MFWINVRNVLEYYENGKGVLVMGGGGKAPGKEVLVSGGRGGQPDHKEYTMHIINS
jgi:hypothetical protein